MVTVKWKCDDAEMTFVLDDRKSWKGKMIRGYDVAEMIAYEYWTKTQHNLSSLEIISPAVYKGIYSLKAEFEPTFSAKRVDIPA